MAVALPAALTPEVEPQAAGEANKPSFLEQETERIYSGLQTLLFLQTLPQEKTQALLRLDEVPEEYNFSEEFLTPTATHRLDFIANTPDGYGHEVVGPRIQVNVVRRGDESHPEIIAPTGGGIRAITVPGEWRDGAWQLPDKEKLYSNALDEAGGLAAAMGPKVLGLEFRKHLRRVLQKMERTDLLEKADRVLLGGGAKADLFIAVDPHASEEQKKDAILEALYGLGWNLNMLGAIGFDRDRIAGDRNTTFDRHGVPAMQAAADGVIAAAETLGEDPNLARAAVSGKQRTEGGLGARDDATGLGGFAGMVAYAKERDIQLKGKTVFFRGCGSADKRTIQEAYRSGMKVKAISAERAIIVAADTFTDKDAEELYALSVNGEGDKNIAQWARAQDPSRGITVLFESDTNDPKIWPGQLDRAVTNYIHTTQPEIIVDAATQMTIRADNVYALAYGPMIVEIGNGVTTPEAANVMKAQGILHRTPGILTNAGGVFTSYFESMQDVLGVTFADADIEEAVVTLMQENVHDAVTVVDLAAQYGFVTTMEEAYYALAIDRGIAARMEFLNRIQS